MNHKIDQLQEPGGMGNNCWRVPVSAPQSPYGSRVIGVHSPAPSKNHFPSPQVPATGPFYGSQKYDIYILK